MDNILLTFVGENDRYPFEHPGAILTILEDHKFDKVYLLYDSDRYLKAASDILKYCKQNYPKLKVLYKETPVDNPTDYNTVYPAMYKSVKDILEQEKKAEYTISVTSGTPTMHSCWIFLVEGCVIDANLIQVHKETGVSEINFELDDFPKINEVDSIKAELTKLSRENKSLKKDKLIHDRIVGKSKEILEVKDQIKTFSDTDLSIYISGESGTGKELVAEALHYNSKRKEQPFVPVNCGAISENLFESEFFGHKKGSFTGAISDKVGKFKQADKGTIFLDEVCDLPPNMQTKLLRVLQEQIITPVGSNEEISIDIRIIAASNKNIKKLVKDGDVREDLFYRLVKAQIHLPPLRARGDDKILIAKHILSQLNQKYNQNKKFKKSAINKIVNYQWPGNVRQLINSIEAAYMYPGKTIEKDNINIVEAEGIDSNINIPDNGVDLENDIIPKYYKAALKKSDGNKAEAARLLGIKPHTFRERLRKIDQELII